MLWKAGVDFISLLSKAVTTFKLKTNKLFTSLHMNKLSFLNLTLHPAFLPPNILYLAYAVLCDYWKHSNLE